MISNISITDFLKRNVNNNIIDIRSPQKYNNNHIPGSRNIPFEKLLLNPEKYINKHTVYYIYCQKGIKSITLCRRLSMLGYQVINISGGYESWILEK